MDAFSENIFFGLFLLIYGSYDGVLGSFLHRLGRDIQSDVYVQRDGRLLILVYIYPLGVKAGVVLLIL
jgi:hypothetical protein